MAEQEKTDKKDSLTGGNDTEQKPLPFSGYGRPTIFGPGYWGYVTPEGYIDFEVWD